MDRRTFLAAFGGAVGIPGGMRMAKNVQMKSATIRFSQIHYHSTGEYDPTQSPAEQFDEWRFAEKRDILAISLGEEPIVTAGESTVEIAKRCFIDILYQIPERECHGVPVHKQPL